MPAFSVLRDSNVKTRQANLYHVPTESGARRAKSIVQSVLQHTNALVLTCLHHNVLLATGAMGAADSAASAKMDTIAGETKSSCSIYLLLVS